MTESRPLIIGVAGGTGSGKTTLVRALVKALGDEKVTRIQHDSYYRDLSHLPFEERIKVNYDHPDSLETGLLEEHLSRLLQGESVEVPTYDFVRHLRGRETESIVPGEMIIVEGILALVEPGLRDLMDLKIFVDTDADVRILRRLGRDVSERGRTVKSVIMQYLETVRPMHLEHVEPSRRWADLVVSGEGDPRPAAESILERIRGLQGQPD